ncbi:GDP-L-fucose synthase [uncultured archaeon]|nr:GDP-L-fucose synthase [uncultured archaeon]
MDEHGIFGKNTLNEFKGKNILITGGTGSIGIGIIKELTKYQPNAIRIFTNDENSIFETRKMIVDKSNFTFMMGDIRDRERLNLAIRNVDIVFHAAAMKHIDICEENPFDAVKTNVVGTSNVLEASLLENVSKFILISTDKATNPTSTLGASKLLAERLTAKASSYRGKGKTTFAIVRFGNVIGSRGSVFQIFLDQIRKEMPFTVTDEKMTRFIMSIHEAASLILKITHVAEDGEIYILKMPSVRILDLAKSIAKVYSTRYARNEKKSPSIRISKAREGERFHEFLVSPDEIPFCHDIGPMYKISKDINKKKIPLSQFSSETAVKISQDKLERIILELLDEFS